MKPFYAIVLLILMLCACNSPKSDKIQEVNSADTTMSINSQRLLMDSTITAKGLEKAFVRINTSSLSCPSIPTQTEVTTGRFQFYNYSCSRNSAVKVGIPIASANASYNFRMFVQDLKRYKTCTSPDGTVHEYGQVVRFVIEVSDYDIGFGGSFSALAISGSTKGMNASIYIYSDGIDNTQLLPAIGAVSGKPFNVDTYKDYGALLEKINSILGDKNTKFSVNEIGIEPKEDYDEKINYVKAPIITAALYAIKDKTSYNELIKRDFNTNKAAIEVIKDVYGYIGIPTNDTKPTDRNVLDAKDYIAGIKIRN